MYYIAMIVLLTNMAVFGTVKAEDSMPVEERPHYYYGYGSNLYADFLNERLKKGEWTSDYTRAGEIEGPAPEDLGVYELRDYEFSYNLDDSPVSGDDCTWGNVTKVEGSKVYGALYKISQLHLDELDRNENAVHVEDPEQLTESDKEKIEGKSYLRVAMKVHKVASEIIPRTEHTVEDDDEVTAWAYIGNPTYVTHEPNPEEPYINLLVKAAEGRNFPKAYVDAYLRVHATAGAAQ